MKAHLLAGFISLACYGMGLADGFPFDEKTQTVRCDSLRFQLDGKQASELVRTGCITLADEQLRILRKFYPNASSKQAVIAATVNDNNENLGPDDVYCLWVEAFEIAVTLNYGVISSPEKAAKALATPKDYGAASSPSTQVRISPLGELFFRGEKTTLHQTLKMIDSIKPPEKGEFTNLSVVVPPPGDPERMVDNQTANSKVLEVYAALQHYGRERGIDVCRSW
ncbi:MAG: hypothetical protein J0M04_10545 [Verrucomicrobia bacterium]|nr:hypothetical protein [Verrucomicrobiota bacterium]